MFTKHFSGDENKWQNVTFYLSSFSWKRPFGGNVGKSWINTVFNTFPVEYLIYRFCIFCVSAEFLSAKEDGEASPTFDTKDPLNKALGMWYIWEIACLYMMELGVQNKQSACTKSNSFPMNQEKRHYSPYICTCIDNASNKTVIYKLNINLFLIHLYLFVNKPKEVQFIWLCI